MYNNFLSPDIIVSFLKNNINYKNFLIDVFNNNNFKQFIQNNVGYNFQSLKQNLIIALNNTKKSARGIQNEKALQYNQKIQLYRQMATKLINVNGLSVYSAIILSAGFIGIDVNKVVQFLNQKGYNATRQKIQNYYKNNEGFLKSILKNNGTIIPGWNDKIQVNDLEIENKQFIQVPLNDASQQALK